MRHIVNTTFGRNKKLSTTFGRNCHNLIYTRLILGNLKIALLLTSNEARLIEMPEAAILRIHVLMNANCRRNFDIFRRTFVVDELSYSTICCIDVLSYSTKCRVDYMVFD